MSAETETGCVNGHVMGEEHIILNTELPLEEQGGLPIFKKVSRRWKCLPKKGDDVTIRDPKLKQGYLGDLKKKTIIELEDALKRQNVILSNRNLLSTLPDKGERLRLRQKEIADALAKAKERERTLRESDLHVDIHALEWRDMKGSADQAVLKSANSRQQNRNDAIDSDDDDDDLDPLELMANHSSCVKKTIHNESWSDEEDPAAAIARELQQMELRDAEESANTIGDSQTSEEMKEKSKQHCNSVPSNANLDFGTKRIQMMELRRLRNGEVREPFKPFRRLANPQPIPDLQKMIDSHRPKSDRKVQMISLQESITLERGYLAKTKERELKNTTQALSRMKRERIKIGLPPKSSAMKYRDVNVTDHLLDSDEENYCYLPANAEYDFEDLDEE